jgi:predicted GIY-YIG superfamily endonuclease
LEFSKAFLFLNMPYFIYILKSTTGRRYIGYTSNLLQRLSQHNRKHHGSTNRVSEEWSIEDYLELQDKKTAMSIETHLKSLKNSEKALKYIHALKTQG